MESVERFFGVFYMCRDAWKTSLPDKAENEGEEEYESFTNA